MFTSSPAGLCVAFTSRTLLPCSCAPPSGAHSPPNPPLPTQAASSEPHPPPHAWMEELIPCGKAYTVLHGHRSRRSSGPAAESPKGGRGALEGGASLALTLSWWRRLELGQPERGGPGSDPENSVKGPATFCPLMSCGNNHDNRCLRINQMSLVSRSTFPGFRPVRTGNVTVLKARRVWCRIRPGVGSRPGDVSGTLWEGPGAQRLPVFLVRNSSSPEHLWHEGQDGRNTGWEAAGGLLGL